MILITQKNAHRSSSLKKNILKTGQKESLFNIQLKIKQLQNIKELELFGLDYNKVTNLIMIKCYFKS